MEKKVLDITPINLPCFCSPVLGELKSYTSNTCPYLEDHPLNSFSLLKGYERDGIFYLLDAIPSEITEENKMGKGYGRRLNSLLGVELPPNVKMVQTTVISSEDEIWTAARHYGKMGVDNLLLTGIGAWKDSHCKEVGLLSLCMRTVVKEGLVDIGGVGLAVDTTGYLSDMPIVTCGEVDGIPVVL